MTLTPGTKVIDVITVSGKIVSIPYVAPVPGDKFINLMTAGGPVAQKYAAPAVGDKYLMVQTPGGPVALAVIGNTNRWTRQNLAARWSSRSLHGSVILSSDRILVIGGNPSTSFTEIYKDVWRSSDLGRTWVPLTINMECGPRTGHACVVLADGTILIMGGYTTGYTVMNDVWKSIDGGATWTLVTASAGWSVRGGHSSVVLADGTIIVMGGTSSSLYNAYNDVWKSIDGGATWTLVTSTPGWSTRHSAGAVVLLDGSVVMMGGYNPLTYTWESDVWRSTDGCIHWTEQSSNGLIPVGYTDGRQGFGSVVMTDGTIMVMGGYNSGYLNDVIQSSNLGVTWTTLPDAPWYRRHGFGCVRTSDNRIIISGGTTYSYAGGPSALNDVWKYT